MLGLKPLFGKRTSAQRPATGIPNHAVFPKEVFEGDMGAFLREAGFAPDDPRNHNRFQAPVADLIAADEEMMVRALAHANAASEYPVGGFLLLPKQLWQGRCGPFLMQQLDLSPFRPWNVIILPTEAAGARALQLPIGREGNVNLLEVETFVEMIAEMYSGKSDSDAEVSASLFDSIAENFKFLFPPEIRDYSAHVVAARRRVRALAFYFGFKDRFDKAEIIRSQQMFLAQPDMQLVA